MIENKEINRTFDKYPEYKDSGVEWLGEIPSHWEVKKMKFLGSIFPGLSGKKGDDFSKEFKADFKPFIPFTNICNNLKINADQYQYVHIGEFEVQNKVRKNDILFLMSSETLEDIGKCSLYNGENKELYLNSFCKGFRFFSNKLSTYFVNYLLHGQIYRNYFSLVGRGFTRINLKQEYINDAPIVLPLLPEQTTIANFLDNKTSKIDTAIAQKEQMIALLKERKQIVIQNAVTGKWSMVNGQWVETPKERMKDSGVEWLGEIPKEWEAIKMKYLFRDISIKNKPEEELLSVTQNQGVVPRTWVENRMVMPSGNLESFKFIRKGDFAISLRSFEGGLEYCHHDGIISPAYTVLKKDKELVDNYYKYLFKSYSFISEIQTSVVGIREGKNISYPILSYSLLPFPSLQEQTTIATFLDDKTSKIDRAITLQQTQIEKLKEYKATLIDSAVTGKIKING